MKKKQLTYLALAGAMALMACGSLLCGNSIVSYENVVGKTQTYSTTDHCTYINSPIVEAPVRHNALVTYSVTQVNDNTTDVKIWYNPNDRGPLSIRVLIISPWTLPMMIRQIAFPRTLIISKRNALFVVRRRDKGFCLQIH